MGKHIEQFSNQATSNGAEFSLHGEIMQLTCKDDGRYKRLHVMTPEGLQVVKVSKYARIDSLSGLMIGDHVYITGWRTVDRCDGEVKLKAFHLSRQPLAVKIPGGSGSVGSEQVERGTVAEDAMPRSPKPPTILVCQKCLKKSGDGLTRALETALDDRNLSHVTIKKTGCMNQCKTGPHVVVMPDKAHYSRVQPEMVAVLVDRHLVAQR
jgi:(2Fe-2S) ferredoxin